jgi:hypothetical protein
MFLCEKFAPESRKAMTDELPEELAERAVYSSADAAEAILSTMGDLPPFGIAFFADGKRQIVAPFEDAETAEQATHDWLRTQVAKQLEAVVRLRDDVVAVTTILADDGPAKVYIQLETRAMLAPPLAFPVSLRDGRHNLEDPHVFEQRIAAPIFPR